MAKILSQEGTASPIGGLIGIMVEEEADIAKVDVSGLTTGDAAPAKEEPAQAPPKQEAQPA